MQSIRRLCLRLAMMFAVLLPGMAAAQVALGSRCDTLQTVNGLQTITLTQAVDVDQWIIISAAANNTFVQFSLSAVTDTAGNSYPINDDTVMAASSGALATFAGRVVTALNVGDQITVTYLANGSTTTQSCVQASAFSDVLVTPADPTDAYGESSGTGPAQSVMTDTPTQFGSDLIYSVFASAQTPGAMVALAPAQGIDQVCSTDNSLCLLSASNLGAVTAGAMEAADATSANGVAWGALAIAFRSSDRIFADGFDGD